MSNFELHVSRPVFGGCLKPLEEADYVIIGVPFDVTSTYRTGARFAPQSIREASLNIETYSFRSELDLEDLKLHDLGDLHISGNTGQTLERLEFTLKDLLVMKKIPVLLGGEHTITLGAMRAVGGKSTAVISLDAHMDLRSQFMDLTTSHTTFMRRVHEEVCPMKIVEVGIRAVCREELEYAKNAGIEFFTMKQIQEDGVESTVEAVKKVLTGCERSYLTIDMDVLDPAFASAVQNPEPDGMSMQTLLDMVSCLCDHHLVGLDLVEVTPPYDNGTTSIQAAKIIFEVLCQIERARKS